MPVNKPIGPNGLERVSLTPDVDMRQVTMKEGTASAELALDPAQSYAVYVECASVNTVRLIGTSDQAPYWPAGTPESTFTDLPRGQSYLGIIKNTARIHIQQAVNGYISPDVRARLGGVVQVRCTSLPAGADNTLGILGAVPVVAKTP